MFSSHNSPPRPPAPRRRQEDGHWWWYYGWARKVWPIILVVGGWGWHQAWDWYQGIPSHDKVAQYDAGLALIPEFYRVRSEVETLKRELSEDRELSQAQRAEIIHRLDVLDERLSRWFEQASKPPRRDNHNQDGGSR